MCIPLLPLGLVLMVLAVLRFRSIPAFHETSICIRCRYSMEGLPRAGMCPECGRRYDFEDPTLRTRYKRTPREKMALYGVTLAAALAAAAIGCAVATVPFSIEVAAYSLIVSLVSVLPSMVMILAADGRVPQRVAWTIAIAGSVPSALFAAIGFGDSVSSQLHDPYSDAAWGGSLLGLMVSTVFVGLLGVVASHDAVTRVRAA